ncbi:A kinase (PRKA) anchor protein 14 [Cichlidogyrus casuarinus]|uniref:A kinase (PRKA) anchor protein 14 n=1 Tax=Cichlidogyrus casuarinus TaxID=1844966 RepID=A0ABD2QP20_9PLAT
MEAVEEFLKTWQLSEKWLHNTTQLATLDEEFKTTYTYRVMLSIPTKSKPIPAATASVYFTLTIWKIKPKDEQVEVTYRVQGNRLIIRPSDKGVFQERWLDTLISHQEQVMKQCEF